MQLGTLTRGRSKTGKGIIIMQKISHDVAAVKILNQCIGHCCGSMLCDAKDHVTYGLMATLWNSIGPEKLHQELVSRPRRII